jgi:hypothetical protein
MLRKVHLHTAPESYLTGYRLSDLSFEQTDLPYASLVPIWDAMRNGEWDTAGCLAREAMDERRIFHPEERAAMNMALAEAERRLGATDSAKRLAGRSLDLFANQHASHRILISVHLGRKDFTAAYLHLANHAVGDTGTSWDSPLDYVETHTALAAWAWQLGEWDQVADHLLSAWPEGPAQMPAPLREDWFRLALYRGQAEDAAEVAALLVAELPVDRGDEILQTMVQKGWMEQALPIYTEAFTHRTDNELLRRRLVALNIKQGNIEEARRLTRTGALRLAA